LSVFLPTGWNIAATTEVLLSSSPQVVDKDGTGSYRAVLAFGMGTVNKAPSNMVALGAAQQAATAKKETGYQVLEKPTAVTIGVHSAVKFGGTFTRGGAVVRAREYFLMAGNNRVYTITFTSLSSKWAGYESLVERSVATFKPKK
jgi:hypothetical protein